MDHDYTRGLMNRQVKDLIYQGFVSRYWRSRANDLNVGNHLDRMSSLGAEL